MAINMAIKRARKAAHRKAVLAERRKAEAFDASLAGRVRLAAGRPIRHCALSEGLFETGMGTLFLARDLPNGQFALASFLLDAFCLGVKDVHLRSASGGEVGRLLAMMDEVDPMAAVEPAYARKLLSELAAWSASYGLQPHPDFARVEPLFGDVQSADSDASFQFGRNGKPFYVAGRFEPPPAVRRRIEQLRKQVGDEGFDYVALVD